MYYMQQPMDKFIQDIARKAGNVIKAGFGTAKVVRTKKHPADVVTEADLAAEKLITTAIRKCFPTHGIVAEESGTHNGEAEYVWYIDPLDGTFSFSRGTPVFCTMVGLSYKKEPILSVIFDPNVDRFYFAKRGKGAFLNGKRIRCSTQKDWAYSYGMGPTNLRRSETIDMLQKFASKARKEPFWLSSFGSFGVSVGYTACGARDWYMAGYCNDHEAPTASLLLKEAGCVVTTKEGKPWRMGDGSMLAANKYLHPQLLRLVRGKR